MKACLVLYEWSTYNCEYLIPPCLDLMATLAQFPIWECCLNSTEWMFQGPFLSLQGSFLTKIYSCFFYLHGKKKKKKQWSGEGSFFFSHLVAKIQVESHLHLAEKASSSFPVSANGLWERILCSQLTFWSLLKSVFGHISKGVTDGLLSHGRIKKLKVSFGDQETRQY